MANPETGSPTACEVSARNAKHGNGGRSIDPPGITSNSLNPADLAYLTVQGISLCHGGEAIIAEFLRVLRLCTQRYLAAPENETPRLTEDDLRLGFDELQIKRLVRLLATEPGILGSGQGPNGKFDRELSDYVHEYAEVSTIEEYLAVRDRLTPPRERALAVPSPIDPQPQPEPGWKPVPAEPGLRRLIRERPEKGLDAPASIFLVHGHDGAAKHETARLLRQLTGRDPVILHEQPNKGLTVIEKFEAHAEQADFALVLLTPDDEGRAVGQSVMQARARQNVIFELGFFVGTLGRGRVAVLFGEGVELPSDMSGILYTVLDAAGAWKMKLASELRAAGIDVALDQVL